MAIDPEQYLKLKRRAEKARSDADRAEGVLEEQRKKLKSEFGVDSIEEAQKLLDKITEEEKEAEERYNVKLVDFETKWGRL